MAAYGALCVTIAFVLLMSCIARDFTYTFQVPAGKTECFYEYVHQGAYLEIEYQVRVKINLGLHKHVFNSVRTSVSAYIILSNVLCAYDVMRSVRLFLGQPGQWWTSFLKILTI